MEYRTVLQVANQWGISDRRVRALCQQGKIRGASHQGRVWLIPAGVEKPVDGRTTRHRWRNGPFAEVEARKAELTAGGLFPEREGFEMDFVYHSVKLEGSSLTRTEVEQVMAGRPLPDRSSAEQSRVLGTRDALQCMRELVKEDHPFSEQALLSIHARNLREKANQRDLYRQESSEMIPRLMRGLVADYENMQQQMFHPIEQAAIVYLRFESIRPFETCGSATGRVLINLLLMRAGYPPVYIHSQDQRRYADAINEYVGRSDPEPMSRLLREAVLSELKAMEA